VKRIVLLLALASAVVFAASPGNRIATVQGANVQCFLTNDGGTRSTGRTGLDLDIQCPNIDGGAGQKNYIRAGCAKTADGGGSCVQDAGVGDLIMDFTSATGSADPIHFKLGPAEDRFCIADSVSYATAVYCTVHERRP
jgi:hypothetical protein